MKPRRIASALVFLIAVACAAHAQDPFGSNFPPVMSFKEYYQGTAGTDGAGGYKVTVVSSMLITVRCSMQGVDLSQINGNSTVDFNVTSGGTGMEILQSLSDDPNWVDGNTSAKIPITASDGFTQVGFISISWNAKGMVAYITVTNDAADYSMDAQAAANNDVQYLNNSYSDVLEVDFTFGNNSTGNYSMYVTGTVAITQVDQLDVPTIDLSGQDDTTPPTNVVINPPAAGSATKVAPGVYYTQSKSLPLTGTAVDALSGVEPGGISVMQNSQPAQTATYDNTAHTWAITLTLVPGWNYIYITATDMEGNSANSKVMTVFFDSRTGLTLNVSGSQMNATGYALVRPSGSNTAIASASPSSTSVTTGNMAAFRGLTYTAIAYPPQDAANRGKYLFDHWEVGPTSGQYAVTDPTLNNSTSPVVQFKMQGTSASPPASYETLTAVFAPNPFNDPAVRGSYFGVLHGPSGSGGGLKDGVFYGTLSALGQFTGGIKVGYYSVPLNITFTPEKTYNGRVTISGRTYTLALSAASGQITGTITDSNNDAFSISSDLSVYNAGHPVLASFAGTYNLLLPASSSNTDTNYPVGIGSAQVTLGATGSARFIAFLGDGTVATAAGYLTQNNALSIYSSLYGGLGEMSGVLTFTDPTNATNTTDVTGALDWNKEGFTYSPASKTYSEYKAFAGQSRVVGAMWNPALALSGVPSGSLFLNQSTTTGMGTMAFNAPALAQESALNATAPVAIDAHNMVTITPAGQILPSPAPSVNLLLPAVRPTGWMVGSFYSSANPGYKTPLIGIVVNNSVGNKVNAAGGYFPWYRANTATAVTTAPTSNGSFLITAPNATLP